MRVRAARGAIVVGADTAEAVLASTEHLLGEMIGRNGVATDDLVSILFTATEDIRAAFPAEAARRMGLGSVPLMCACEIPVSGSKPSVVRVLMHFHSDLSLGDVTHVYLEGAESLRDDLDVAG
jgi:chorismate mutase